MPEPFNPYHEWLGIPAGRGRPHHYLLLGIPLFEEAANVIENAADRQMAHLRTFQAGGRAAESQRVLNEVAAAKVCLLKPEQKAAYDARLRAALAMRSPNAQTAGAAAADEFAPRGRKTTATSAGKGARGAGKQKNREEPKTWKGPGTYSLVMLVVGVVGLAGVLWYRATFPTPQAVVAKPGQGHNAAAGDSNKSETNGLTDAQRQAAQAEEVARVMNSPEGILRSVATSEANPQTWRYIVKQPPGDWNATDFHDDSWRQGPGAFSPLGGGDPKNGSRWNSNDIWLRRTFDLPDLKLVPSVVRICHDDDAEVYINGVLAAEFKDFVPQFVQVDISAAARAAFKQGRNVLAVHCQRTSGNQFIDVGLVDLRPAPESSAPAARPNAIANTSVPPLDLPIEPLDAPIMPDAPNDPDAPLMPEAPVQLGKPTKPEPPVAKTPIPSEAQQSEARKLVEDLFKSDLAMAKKAGTTDAIAKKLLQQATDSGSDAAGQYVLYCMTRDIAAEAGDVLVAMQAIDGLARTFPIDALEMKAAAVEKASHAKVGPAFKNALIDAALPLIDQAAAAERFALVQQLGKAALGAAIANRDLARANQLRALGREMVAAQKHFDELHAALDSLQKTPDDPAANLTVGLWRCLTKGDWTKGAANLKKSGEPLLADLAKREIAKPADAEGQQKLADAWWDMAETQSSESLKMKMRAHAVARYREAIPALTGLMRARSEKRVEEVASGATAPASNTVDLLKLIDPARDSANGHWKTQRGALVSPHVDAAKLVIPFVPPHDYLLTVEGTRASGAFDGLAIGIVVDGKQAMVVVDGLGASVSGMEMVDGKPVKDNSTRVDVRNVLGENKPFSISIAVHTGSVKAIANQRDIVDWKGNSGSLSLSGYWVVPRHDCLFLGAERAEIKFTKVSIKAINGPGK